MPTAAELLTTLLPCPQCRMPLNAIACGAEHAALKADPTRHPLVMDALADALREPEQCTGPAASAEETREAALREAAAAIKARRNEHWQRHLREHPYADGQSCPGDYAAHDAYYDAARIVRDLRGAS